MEVSIEEEIGQVNVDTPHVVILGAGASRASFENGDKNGKCLPLMNDLIDILKLEELMDKTKISFESNNFENIYDIISKDNSLQNIRVELEDRVYKYFENLEITDEPTIYDHLVLSLRDKDIIATFNWDPFLIQAYTRNSRRGFKLPKLLFLHGNVAVGYCEKDGISGVNGRRCSHCNEYFIPTKLLYPISEKNYHKDSFIKTQWELLQQELKSAFMITIFGYGAPQSDISAIELMKFAWGNVEEREMEQTEIIDIRNEEELEEVWKPFIHTHHSDFHKDFYNSWIANHPRRTGEAYFNQYWEAKFIENNPIPSKLKFNELWDWFCKLQEAERKNEE